eukprot:403358822
MSSEFNHNKLQRIDEHQTNYNLHQQTSVDKRLRRDYSPSKLTDLETQSSSRKYLISHKSRNNILQNGTSNPGQGFNHSLNKNKLHSISSKHMISSQSSNMLFSTEKSLNIALQKGKLDNSYKYRDGVELNAHETLDSNRQQSHQQSQNYIQFTQVTQENKNEIKRQNFFTAQDSQNLSDESILEKPLIEVIKFQEQDKIRSMVTRHNFFSEVLIKKDGQGNLHIADDYDEVEQQSDSRRESIMSSFQESDINEGTRNHIPTATKSCNLAKKINKNSFHQQKYGKPFEIPNSQFKEANDQDIFIISHQDVQPQIEESKMVILSRIDHNNTPLNQSKESAMELEMLLNLSDQDNYPQSVQKADAQHSMKNLSMKSSFNIQTNQLNRNLSRVLRQSNQINISQSSQRGQFQLQKSSTSKNLKNHSISHVQHDYSDPINLHLDVEEEQSDHNQQSEATESIKCYLIHLKSLKNRYHDIVKELQVEENMNIQAATHQILSSDEFRRMSLGSGTKLLTSKIIEIRDEYRHVMSLLKSQHQFDENATASSSNQNEGSLDQQENSSQV